MFRLFPLLNKGTLALFVCGGRRGLKKTYGRTIPSGILRTTKREDDLSGDPHYGI